MKKLSALFVLLCVPTFAFAEGAEDSVFQKMDKAIAANFAGSDVWKDENGEFNTSRLVSDSVAGVVLGTVGGIITSNVIKKNQIEDGLQDLICTIAGQDVARYGDEFEVSVGIK